MQSNKPLIFRIKHFLWLLIKRYRRNKNRYDYTINPYSQLFVPNLNAIEDSLVSRSRDVLTLSSRDYYTPYIRIKIGNSLRTLGIESWITNKVILKAKCFSNKRPLLRGKDYSVFWQEGALYKQDVDGVYYLTHYELDDILYCDMISQGNWFALRTGGRVDLSKDLVEWKTIYKGKRGIKDSMLFVGNDDDLSLLFIEYTPGEVRERHHILRYSINKEQLETVKTFYTLKEYKTAGLLPCARHIHVIAKDPYTGDIYVSTGDFFEECGIHVSKDNGVTYNTEFFGAQDYRALAFIFSEKYVFWNTDTHESQAIIRMDKNTKELKRYALLNGALWCSILYPEPIFNTNFYIMSSNSEGALYDNNNRVYGIIFQNDEPIVFELLKKRSRTEYSQQFVLGVDLCNSVYLYDTDSSRIKAYEIEIK